MGFAGFEGRRGASGELLGPSWRSLGLSSRPLGGSWDVLGGLGWLLGALGPAQVAPGCGWLPLAWSQGGEPGSRSPESPRARTAFFIGTRVDPCI